MAFTGWIMWIMAAYHRLSVTITLFLFLLSTLTSPIVIAGELKNCHTEINQTIRVEPYWKITFHCIRHNVSSFALLSMVITVPCEDEHVEVYGPQDYADHILHGQFAIISNFSTPIKEKVACCNFTTYDIDVHQSNHQLYNCTLILPMKDADNQDGPSMQFMIGIIVTIVLILTILFILLLVGFVPLYQCLRKISVKRDDSGDSDKSALYNHPNAKPRSKGVQQSNKNDSDSDRVYVHIPSVHDKKELASMHIDDDTEFRFEYSLIQSVKKSDYGEGVNDINAAVMPTRESSFDADVMLGNLQEAEGAMEPPIDLPSPVTNLTIPEEEEEGKLNTNENVENFAKDIDSDISTCSVDQYIDESGESAAVEKKTVTESETLPTSDSVFRAYSSCIEEIFARFEADFEALMESLKENLEDTFPEECVQLDGISHLGLSYSDGENEISHVFGQGCPGIYISEIKTRKGGPAEAISNLRLGDRVLKINNHDVRCANLQQVKQLYSELCNNDSLLVQHVPQPLRFQRIVVAPDTEVRIGVPGGGIYLTKGNPLDKDDKGIFISKIAIGGAAHKDGRLHEGDRILEINGISLLHSRTPYLDAYSALMRSPDKIEVTFCQGYNPKEVLRKKSEAEAAASSMEFSYSKIVRRLTAKTFHNLTLMDVHGFCFEETLKVPKNFIDDRRGWNACSSIRGDTSKKYNRFILPSLFSLSDTYTKGNKTEEIEDSYSLPRRPYAFPYVTDVYIPSFWISTPIILIDDGYQHNNVYAKTVRRTKKWNLYSTEMQYLIQRDFTFAIPNASIKEPYKEPYKHDHELCEPVISAVLALLAMTCIQLQNDLYLQNSVETN